MYRHRGPPIGRTILQHVDDPDVIDSPGPTQPRVPLPTDNRMKAWALLTLMMIPYLSLVTPNPNSLVKRHLLQSV